MGGRSGHKEGRRHECSKVSRASLYNREDISVTRLCMHVGWT